MSTCVPVETMNEEALVENSEAYPDSPSSHTSSEHSSSDGSSSKDEEGSVSLESIPLPYTVHPISEMSNGYSHPVKSRHQMVPERVFSEGPSGHRFSAVLETADLWKQFDDIGTEMIVTRRGRYILLTTQYN